MFYMWMHHVTSVNASHVCVSIMSHMWIHRMCVTSHFTHVNASHVCDKSCHTCDCIVSQVNESCHTCERVMSHVWTNKKLHIGTSHVTHVNKWFISCWDHLDRTCELVMSHMWTSHVILVNESSYTRPSHTACQLIMPRWNKPYHTCERVMAHKSCHTY